MSKDRPLAGAISGSSRAWKVLQLQNGWPGKWKHGPKSAALVGGLSDLYSSGHGKRVEIGDPSLAD